MAYRKKENSCQIYIRFDVKIKRTWHIKTLLNFENNKKQ